MTTPDFDRAPSIPEKLSNPLASTVGEVVTAMAVSEGTSKAETYAHIRELVTGGPDQPAPDAVFSFSGGIKYDESHGIYRTLAYSDLSEHGLVTGSRARVIATAEIAKAIPDVPVVTNSFNRFDPTEPTMASVIARELIQPVRGVEESRVIQEDKSFSTVTQLIEMIKLANENKWDNVAIVGNWWHFPRMTRMYENLDKIVTYEDPAQQAAFVKELATFREREADVRFVACEDVLRTTNSKYARYLDAAEATEAFQKTLAAEKQGVADLDAGKYRIVLRPEKPRE